MRNLNKRVLVGFVLILIAIGIFFGLKYLGLENLLFSLVSSEPSAVVIVDLSTLNVYNTGLMIVLLVIVKIIFDRIFKTAKPGSSKSLSFLLILGVLGIVSISFINSTVFYPNKVTFQNIFSVKDFVEYKAGDQISVLTSVIPDYRKLTKYSCSVAYTVNVPGFNHNISINPRDHKKLGEIVDMLNMANVPMTHSVTIAPNRGNPDCEEVYKRELKSLIEKDLRFTN